ncbi:MAG TPA: ABC transporter permease subunit [Aggregatilinea sp.]|uniref:ABC transporter permease n=1 Tax=Aggregatilinea sp. TaxID=2806333 RepID=UPI002C2EDAB7|nr:ABC transporter permease subunit [Aggregatilinea sp.]HML20951.1 ABC transporter permease subunit [Aggregatilinea sp.]
MLNRFSGIFKVQQPTQRTFGWADAVVIALVVVVIYAGVRLAIDTPAEIEGPSISLAPEVLPYYALRSVGRMAAAYTLSLVFALVYGRAAAYHRRAEQVLMPLLDVLQSVPILSFLPVVLLSLSAILPQAIAAELASIVLIFTSQAWNLGFGWYQSLTTIPNELNEAAITFRFNTWMRFRTLELPFAAIGLLWNSMMSWAGGWFFLMAAEIFTVGDKDFRLLGLGAYLQEAANQEDYRAIGLGIATLVLVIVLLDQLVWRPLLAWADRFKLEMTESDNPPTSWFYDLLRTAHITNWLDRRMRQPVIQGLDALFARSPLTIAPRNGTNNHRRRPWFTILVVIALGVGLVYGLTQAGQMLVEVPAAQWTDVGLGVAATLLRVMIALVIALAWTIPVGVLIGTNPRIATVLQPVVQVTASIPATALFPVLLLVMLQLPAGLNIAAVLLMLMGTQWYLLFNIIAGAAAIPQDLKFTSTLLRLDRRARWRTLILPALFPYIITGAITASGGAWNASIVAEYFQLGGKTHQVTGVGALIADATAAGDFHLLLAATLSMILTVVLINRLFWRRLYRRAEEQYRME